MGRHFARYGWQCLPAAVAVGSATLFGGCDQEAPTRPAPPQASEGAQSQVMSPPVMVDLGPATMAPSALPIGVGRAPDKDLPFFPNQAVALGRNFSCAIRRGSCARTGR